MADHNAHQGGGRRPHFHRGRRGPDRRGGERRIPPPSSEQAGTGREREPVDVEQIMRDIRARIAQRHGIELSTQQVHELAARRLEAILEPRNVNPSLLEQLRKSAGDTTDVALPAAEPPYTFQESTLYDTHRGLLAFFRRLLNPILKLFFNPVPIAEALQAQAQFDAALATREAERERRQAEWNALHYELLQRMVTEVARVSIDVQALATRVESLSTKVDFNERRVRSMENPQIQNRQPHRPAPIGEPSSFVASPSSNEAAADAAPGEQQGDGPRKRRRRRRGRRSGVPGADQQNAQGDLQLPGDSDEGDANDSGEPGDDDAPETETGAGEEPRVAVETAPAMVETPRPLEPLPAAEPVVSQQQHDSAPPQPEPPRDEPTPLTPADHADPGPPDR